jgi:type IV pilus assembly protein PilB
MGVTVSTREELIKAGVKPGEELRFVAQLLRNEHLRPEDVGDFVTEARKHKRSLPNQALAAAVADEADLLGLTAQVYNMRAVSLAEEDTEQEIAQIITFDQARDLGVLPYTRTSAGNLLVAIANPRNVEATDNLPRLLPSNEPEIEWRLVTPSDLTTYMDLLYRDAQMLQEDRKDDGEDEENLIVRKEAIDSRVVKVVDAIIYNAALDGASDIHIEPKPFNTKIRYRLDGDLHEMMSLPSKITPQVVARIKNLAGMKPDERRDAQDGRVTYEVGNLQVDLRIVTMPVIVGSEMLERVVMRVLDRTKAMLTMEELGMTPDNHDRYVAAVAKPHGMALITGPTGSGKSTTLYATMNSRVDETLSLSSIEDPVEYQLEAISQTSVSGGSKMSFASALRAMLRADPDVIMVGEIRDPETAKTAVDAALTGHFIYSTLHTNDAASAVTRLRELGVDGFLLASTLEVVVAQRLIRLLCTDCKETIRADADYMRLNRAPAWAIEKVEREGPMELATHSEKGCVHCRETGYRGRTGVHEVIVITDEIRQAILRDADSDTIETLARKDGMHSLADDAFIRVVAKQTSLPELAKKVS